MYAIDMLWRVEQVSGGWNEVDVFQVVTFRGKFIGNGLSQSDAKAIVKAHNDFVEPLLEGVRGEMERRILNGNGGPEPVGIFGATKL